MSHHDFVAKWAAGEILTSTSPADRAQLKKVLHDYALLEAIISRLKDENKTLKETLKSVRSDIGWARHQVTRKLNDNCLAKAERTIDDLKEKVIL